MTSGRAAFERRGLPASGGTGGDQGSCRAEVVPPSSVAEWFSARTTGESIERWNQTALNLGRPGYPMAERFSVALATTYKNVAGRGLTTVFDVLEADERAL